MRAKRMEMIKALFRDIHAAKHAVAFTGAGISAESGIATYRGEGGLWTKYDPSRYASISSFRQDPSYYWNFFRDLRYPMLMAAKPNPAHLALAELEWQGVLKAVITQNIDGLHQEAGSSNVIELHGTSRTIVCTECERAYTSDEAYSLVEREVPPRCSVCQAVLRPAVVFFGEPLDPIILELAFSEAESSDFLLVVGSSLVVYPAADIPVRAKYAGAKLAIINRDPTPCDDLADYVLHEEAGKVLPQITAG